MFEYLRGYEIDGSDTSFYVVMPEKQKITEVVDYFLSLPLFERFDFRFEENVWAPHRDAGFTRSMPKERIVRDLAERGQEPFYIVAGCAHPSELTGELKSEIYGLSAGRLRNHERVTEGGAEDDGEFHVPFHDGSGSRSPSVGLNHFYDSFVIGLTVNYERPEEMDGEPEPSSDGYVINGASYRAAARRPDCMEFAVTCGPSFVYEYAMYVINRLAARFPELVVTGGLDCAGGFLHGCTYSTSLYAYEVLRLKAGSDVAAVMDVLKRLADSNILYPCYKPKNKKGGYSYQYYVPDEWKATRINSGWTKPETFIMPEYAAYLVDCHATKDSLIKRKQDCAVMFCTGKPAKQDDPVEWMMMAHVTAYPEHGNWTVELHVPYRERERIEAALTAEDLM